MRACQAELVEASGRAAHQRGAVFALAGEADGAHAVPVGLEGFQTAVREAYCTGGLHHLPVGVQTGVLVAALHLVAGSAVHAAPFHNRGAAELAHGHTQIGGLAGQAHELRGSGHVEAAAREDGGIPVGRGADIVGRSGQDVAHLQDLGIPHFTAEAASVDGVLDRLFQFIRRRGHVRQRHRRGRQRCVTRELFDDVAQQRQQQGRDQLGEEKANIRFHDDSGVVYPDPHPVG